MGGEFEKVYQKSSSTLLIFRNWKVKEKIRMIMKVYKMVKKIVNVITEAYRKIELPINVGLQKLLL